ncbi:MAG: CARDB domain-containing protein, partial [Candidatus Methanoculleus thermohydrogenotrophicum]
GRDLDGDGIISAAANPPEGEHYLHPALAMLTLERPRASVMGPDLMLDTIEVKDAFAGEKATIVLTIRNLGVLPSAPVDVKVRIDGDLLKTKQVTIDRSGIQQVSIPWSPEKGSYIIQGEVEIPGDVNPSNNQKEKEVTVGTVPDLAVSIEDPYRPGDAVQQGNTIHQVLVIGAALPLALLLFVRRPPGRYQKMLSLLLGTMVLISLLPPPVAPVLPAVAAQDAAQIYLLPVTVTNQGGSDAPSFALSVYLDGEQVVKKVYPEGLQVGGSERSELPVYASPGSHTVRVVVDEDGLLKDSDRSNNVAEGTYVFS